MSGKVLFVHDGKILESAEEKSYYSIHFGDDIIKRYSFFGDNVTFLMRKEEFKKKDKSNFKKIEYENFNFIEMPDFKSLFKFHKKAKAKQVIKRAVEDHDVIIVRLPSAAGTIAFNYATKTGKPVLVESVACVFDALWNYNWLGKLMAHYKYYQNRHLMKKATHTIYVTSEFLQSRYPSDGKSIGCSDVVLEPISEGILKERLNHIKERNSATLVLGTVAALNVPYKGQADVIAAVGKLKEKGVRVEYKLVGQGDSSRLEQKIMEHGVSDRVEIIGPLQHSQVFKFLDSIDVYIQPSRQEGLPRAMVEALSRGCLATGANTAGIPELIDDKFVFEAGNIEQINSIIENIDEDMLIKQAKRNFDEAKKYQSTELDSKRLYFYRTFANDYGLIV